MKLYIVSETESGCDNIDGIYFLITEFGEVIDSHVCSNTRYAWEDLVENSQIIPNLTGDIEVLFLGKDNMTSEELHRRNQEFYTKKETQS